MFLHNTTELTIVHRGFNITFVPIDSWRLENVDLSWMLMPPQNDFQRLTGSQRASFATSAPFSLPSSTERSSRSSSSCSIIHDIAEAAQGVSIQGGYMKGDSHFEALRLFRADQSLCYQVFELDAPTCKLTVIAVEGVPFLTIAPDIHRKIHETILETIHSSLASLIRGVVEERELVTM